MGKNSYKSAKIVRLIFLNSLDTRQRTLYDKCCQDDTPMREILLCIEKRIYDLENKDIK